MFLLCISSSLFEVDIDAEPPVLSLCEETVMKLAELDKPRSSHVKGIESDKPRSNYTTGNCSNTFFFQVLILLLNYDKHKICCVLKRLNKKKLQRYVIGELFQWCK